MQIRITGKNLDVGENLRGHIDGRLQGISSRYFDSATDGHVTIAKERTRFLADIGLHFTTGLTLQAHGEASDAFPSFDLAAEHLERQLRRYKARIKDHHKPRRSWFEAPDAVAYVIDPASKANGDSDVPDANALVIAETPATLPRVSVSEAVALLEKSTAPFVIFRGSRTGNVNAVYRRTDGNIGWIDPDPVKLS